MATATLLPTSRIRSADRWGRRPTGIVVLPVQRLEKPIEPQAIPVPGIARDIRVQFASSSGDWEQAFRLVAENYQARGYDPAGFDYRFTSYHALPDTVVLVAKERERVVATMSLVPDSSLLGLPMEGPYREEIRQLRQQGRQLFETGSLADQNLGPRDFMQVFVALMQLGWQYMTRQGADTVVIAVNPRHSTYYARMHGFLPLGSRRAYDQVQGAPAEGFYVDPELIRLRVPAMHQRLFGRELPEAALQAPQMPANLVRFFARHTSQTHAGTVEQILWHVRECGSPRRW